MCRHDPQDLRFSLASLPALVRHRLPPPMHPLHPPPPRSLRCSPTPRHLHSPPSNSTAAGLLPPFNKTQACRFRDEYTRFTSAGAAVFGISSDSPADNAAFAKANNLPYPLVTDENSILRKVRTWVGKGTVRCGMRG